MTWLARVLTRKSPSNSFCANNGQEFNQISVVQFDAMLMLATGAKSITAMSEKPNAETNEDNPQVILSEKVCWLGQCIAMMLMNK